MNVDRLVQYLRIASIGFALIAAGTLGRCLCQFPRYMVTIFVTLFASFHPITQPSLRKVS